uniref:DUF4214 domain-containing protein n=1 Tax=Cyanothece sp. (strain PCC 7425 / ATCC 29141) TaxID=395961 RepID=B8HSP7_CYAP4
MKAISIGLIPLAAALTMGSLSTPASAQQRVCDFSVGGVGINCRNEAYYPGYYPGYNPGYYPGYYPGNYPGYNNNYYNRRLNNAEVRSIINGYYRQYLGRSADPTGLRAWINAYNNGQSLEQIRRSIANSPEARAYGRNYGYNYYNYNYRRY